MIICSNDVGWGRGVVAVITTGPRSNFYIRALAAAAHLPLMQADWRIGTVPKDHWRSRRVRQVPTTLFGLMSGLSFLL